MSDESQEYMTEIKPPEPGGLSLMACIFNVGSRTFSVSLQYVQEITEISEIFPLPLTPPYIDGIVHLRGFAIPVINMANIKNIEEDQQKAKHLIVLDFENVKIGIAVKEMPRLGAEFSGELINVLEFIEAYRVA